MQGEELPKKTAFEESVYFSNLRSTSNEVKLLISTLPEAVIVGGEAKVAFNEMKLPKTVDFSTAYNRLLGALAGTFHWDGENGIWAKLDKLASERPEYKFLINRLKKLEGINSIQILNSFRQAMSINQYDYMTYLVDETGGRFIESNMSRAIDKLREELDAEYKESSFYKSMRLSNIPVSKLNKEIVDKLNNIDRLNSENNRDSTKRALMTLLSKEHLGLSLSSDAILNNPAIFKEFIVSMKEIFSSNEEVNSLSDIKMGRFKKVLENEVLNHPNYFEPQHANPENKVYIDEMLYKQHLTASELVTMVRMIVTDNKPITVS